MLFYDRICIIYKYFNIINLIISDKTKKMKIKMIFNYVVCYLFKQIFLYIIFLLTCFKIQAQPGCPNVNAGNDQTLSCNTQCTNLSATFLQTGATGTYSVSSITYSPPYANNSGTIIPVYFDDTWSSIVNLPFNFCFFGSYYNQIVVGSNGVISFNIAYAQGTCPWAFSATCPSSSLPLNSIFGPYHDIKPSIGSNSIRWEVSGTYPCRTFAVKFYEVPMYNCTSLKATHQIVLYEGTNVIEVYMQNKPICSTWNNGVAVVGIQNASGTLGYTPSGRNTSQWTATNEAWRFTPNGSNNYAFVWLQGTSQIGFAQTISVCPTQTTTYTAQVTYFNCDGSQIIVSDDVVVNRNLNITVSPASPSICIGESQVLTASGATSYT
ncbi:MAG: hypothetical protein BWY47_00202 [Bacteroidetes bacterium ADurb.Bin302]|nr:MAG: hypothetical protein BWY47_00202 [Bacteroidetes bacterium ADurb.Bin302]